MVVEGGPNDGSVAGSAQPGRGSSHERPGPGERELALAHIGGSAVAPGFRVVGGINGGHRAVPARNGEPTSEAGAGRSCRGAHLSNVKQDYGCLWAKCSPGSRSSLLLGLGMFFQAAKSVLLVVSALFPIVDPIGGAPVFLSLTFSCDS